MLISYSVVVRLGESHLPVGDYRYFIVEYLGSAIAGILCLWKCLKWYIEVNNISYVEIELLNL